MGGLNMVDKLMEEIDLRDVTGDASVSIPLWRYDELLHKEFAYDVFAEHTKRNKYADNIEKILFGGETDDE